MKTDQLTRTLRHMMPFPEELRNKEIFAKFRRVIGDELTRTKYEHWTTILREGEIPKHCYLVEHGRLRHYYHDSDTNRKTNTYFHGKTMVSLAIREFYFQWPANTYIEASPGTVLLSLSHEQAKKLFIRYPEAERCIKMLLFAAIEFNVEWIHSVRHRLAWQRYLAVLREFPNIEENMSLDNIASYIGITGPWLKKLIRRYGHP